jgi:plastocyanin
MILRLAPRRQHLLLPAVAALSWLALTVPGSSADAAQPQAGGSCSPNGTALSITAFDSKFDKDCLAAPANQAFTIDFSNLDRGIPHNVAIYQDETANKTFFKGELIDGPGKTTYSVQGLAEGTLFFRCDPHPEMHGTFVVAKAAS